MADLLTLLNNDTAIRAASRGTISDMPRLVITGTGEPLQTAVSGFETIHLSAIMVDNKNGWDAANYQWVVPETGTYEVNGKLRLADGDYSSLSYGLGMDTANQDGPTFFWGQGAKNRQGLFNSRIMNLTQGARLRLFAYIDSATPVGISGAEMNAVRIA